MNIKRGCIETVLAVRKMTKAELAAKCGISRQNISTIIRRGTCEPKTAGKLAEGLGVIFGFLPANRAARLEPIDALRYD